MSENVDPHEDTRAEAVRPGKMQAGRPIGGYELRHVLGEGGMGVVWRAHDPKLDREVAIKVLKRGDAPTSLRQRLQREARAMARLKHPNVLTIYDSGTEGERDYIAMELVDGCSLDVWLLRHPLREDVITAMLAAGRGLAAAHRAGLVHRDFKPHNVLRSNDGRVLVTDFGLARGLGDDSQAEGDEDDVERPARAGNPHDATVDARAGEPIATDVTATAVPSTPSTSGARKAANKTDSVLDSPLTQTGVLIGTPAYMAPEQFRGAPPDPRTDQFAFCVTAWQMLTGGRPYDGTNLDELRRAASDGVAHVKSTLAPKVRAILQRGLDPDPEKRWPDLDALLDELEQVLRHKRSKWFVPILIGGTLGSYVLVSAVFDRVAGDDEPATAARACQAADVAFGDAWSPAVRAAVWKDLEARGAGIGEAAFARMADPIDAFRTQWMQSYDEACRAAPDKLPRARLDCLASARDHVGAMQLVLRRGTPAMLEGFDAHGILPNIVVCSGPSPVAPPVIPADKRTRVLELLARAFSHRTSPDVKANVDALLADARAIGWTPLVTMIQVGGANEAVRRGEHATARELFSSAMKTAKETNDIRALANIRIGLLEASMVELVTAETPVRAGALPVEIENAIAAARSTARTAGNDPLFLGATAALEGEALAARARWSYDKRLYKDALAATHEARRVFGEAGDLRRAGIVAAAEARIYLARADERALDDAMFVARSAEEALDRATLPPLRALDELQGQIAFMRGDYGEARARYAKLAPARRAPSPAPEITGKVVDPDGKPVAGATVVAWVGEMHGDPANLVTDARGLDGEIAETEADGTFVVRAPAGAAIVAQRGALRTAPQVVRAAPLTLRLAETTVVAGRVEGRSMAGVDAFAQLAAGDGRWTIRAPVHRDKTFVIGGHPPAPSTIGAIASVDDGTRTVLAIGTPARIEWPHGRALEVIVRGARRDGARVWVFPGRFTEGAPVTRGDVEKLARDATHHATAEPHPIGATATPAGREVYQRGDRHAVITSNLESAQLVCAAADDQPATPIACTAVDVAKGEVTEFPDGRWGTDTQAVVITLP